MAMDFCWIGKDLKGSDHDIIDQNGVTIKIRK
jgi:hypothetical protein